MCGGPMGSKDDLLRAMLRPVQSLRNVSWPDLDQILRLCENIRHIRFVTLRAVLQ